MSRNRSRRANFTAGEKVAVAREHLLEGRRSRFPLNQGSRQARNMAG